jgi:hypothetical protein
MIRSRHHQPSLWTGVVAEEVDDLWEPWMRTADRLLDDEDWWTASAALAFERAAHHYEEALRLRRWRSEEELALQPDLADAFVKAGRGIRAAEIYLKCANRWPD